jgi:tetratricopeptide (TPR) repeat protein
MSAVSPLAAPFVLSQARAHHAQGELVAAAEGYREVLETSPQSRDALLGLSLIARQSRQPLPALRMAEAALAAEHISEPGSEPNTPSALAWANYGDCILPFDSRAAEAAYRQAILWQCDLAPAHYGLGNVLALNESYARALESYERAIPAAPRIAEFHFAAAFALGKLGRHTEAVAAYRRAVHLQPGFASAWLNLGVELIADGKDSLAELCYRQALNSAPGPGPGNVHTRISAHINLGNLKRGRRCFAETQLHYEDALKLTPEGHARLAEVQVAFAYLHLEQEQFSDAWRALELAALAQTLQKEGERGPHNAEIANARGILLLAEHSANDSYTWICSGVLDDLLHCAIEAFALAESLGHKAAASNRGNALLRLGLVEEAISAHQKALALDPHHAGIRYNLALTQIRGGLYLDGWRNYEARWRFREVHPRPRCFAQPRWEGEALGPGSKLLIYAEQGLGDTLQFHRYLSIVHERLPKTAILLEVQPVLKRLFEAVTSGIARFHAAFAIEVFAHGDSLPHFTHHCPLLSLPAVFGTTVATVPAPLPVLEANGELVSRCVEKLHGLSNREKLYVGLNWAGNPNYRADRERSTQLATFLPLLEMPRLSGLFWVSLQKGAAAEQIAAIQRSLPEGCCLYDACSTDRDLADSAAWISCLDLVITTDSAIAHLAGCMGKPVWLLLPWQSDWRWMQEIETTPWYPTARLFRQSSPNNWPELIERVALELKLLLHEKSGHAEAWPLKSAAVSD